MAIYDELDQLCEDIKKQIEEKNTNNIDKIVKRSKMLVKKAIPDSKDYIAEINSMTFYPMIYTDKTSKSDYVEWAVIGYSSLLSTIETVIEDYEIELNQQQGEQNEASKVDEIESTDIGKKVFIVHGQDENLKMEVANFLYKCGLDPVILHEQPNSGKVIIEKLEEYSRSSGYAVVLLSPDDLGKSASTSDEEGYKYRARQNVILELGLFIGNLGRSRVASIYKKPNDKDFEFPSDIFGVTYIPYEGTQWKSDLVKELLEAGYKDIDIIKAIS